MHILLGFMAHLTKGNTFFDTANLAKNTRLGSSQAEPITISLIIGHNIRLPSKLIFFCPQITETLRSRHKCFIGE